MISLSRGQRISHNVPIPSHSLATAAAAFIVTAPILLNMSGRGGGGILGLFVSHALSLIREAREYGELRESDHCSREGVQRGGGDPTPA